MYRTAVRTAGADVEGEEFLRHFGVTTNAAGHGEVFLPKSQFPPNGWLTATATDAFGNTSEFSGPLNLESTRPLYRPVPRARPAAALPPPVAFALDSTDRRRDPAPRGLLG
jgi:hypothetical protein